MKNPIAISLSPNVNREYVSLAKHLLLVHSQWEDKHILSRASEMLARRFSGGAPRSLGEGGGHFVSLASSGRQALYDLLRALDIKNGDEVIIQAFTCIAVPEPIVWVGATPVYADIKEGSYSIDPEDVKKKITSKTKAIIVQHTFGIPGPIEEIMAIAKEKGIFVIEDCAHALPASLNGRSLGTFGDAAIMSFGRDKCISSIFGGAVITKDAALIARISSFQKQRPLPPRMWVAQQLLHPVFFRYALQWYFASSIGKVALVLAQKLGLLSKAVASEERSGQKPVHVAYAYSPALALLLLDQLKKLDSIASRRLQIAARYQVELRIPTPPVGDSSIMPSYLRFPMLVENRDAILLDARSQHMLLGDWYDAPLVPKSSNYMAFGYRIGSCPRAEDAARRVINLPTYPSLTDTQVTKVIDFMNSYGN